MAIQCTDRCTYISDRKSEKVIPFSGTQLSKVALVLEYTVLLLLLLVVVVVVMVLVLLLLL